MALAWAIVSAPALQSGARRSGASSSPVLERLDFLNQGSGYGLFEDSRANACELLVGPTADRGRWFGPLAPVTPCAETMPVAFLAFDGRGDGFAFGPDLFVTHDGGKTWANSPQPGTVVAVAALGESVWAVEGLCPVGASPSNMSATCPLKVLESSDGGRSWTPSTAQPALSASTGALTLEPAQGQSWIVRVSMSSAYVLSNPVVGSGTADSVPLSYTDDGGKTWVSLQIPCGMVALSAVLSAAPDGALVAVCAGQPSAGGQLKSAAVSTDGGRTWAVHSPCSKSATAQCTQSSPLDFGYLGEVDATSATTAYVIGVRSELLVTRDGGARWRADPSVGDVDGSPAEVIFFDAAHGVVLGRRNTASAPIAIWWTSDAGTHWSPIAPSVSSSAWAPPRGGVVLSADGLGVLKVGATMARTVQALAGRLGRPTFENPGVCPGTTEVGWGDLSVEFASGRFAGYRYLASGGPAKPRLETAAGATLGMTLAETRALYPPSAFSMEQDGAIVVSGNVPGGRLFLGFFSDLPSTRLVEVKGGHPCGDF